MFIKQLSVFMENKPGKMGAITQILSKASIDIRALSIADTTDFGILRMIVREPERAVEVLRENNLTAQINDVIVAALEDRIGYLDEIVQLLSKNNIDIHYLYSFIGEKQSASQIVISTNDLKKTLNILKQNNVPLGNEI